MTGPLSDHDIAARIRAGQRCDLLFCREDRDRNARLCGEHRDELARIVNPDYLGERDLERAASIPRLFERLDPTPGSTGLSDRRPPGFASSPPCNLHVVVMRDHRSASSPVVDVWYDPLPAGGDDVESPHYEDSAPPRAVESTVAGIVCALAEDVDHGPVDSSLDTLCRWLHQQLDRIVARDDAAEIFTDLADLHAQLRPAAGDPAPKPVATCTGWVILDPVTREKVECSAPLFMPPPQPGVDHGPARPPKVDPTKPVMRCRRCDRPYTMLQLLRLEIGAERVAG